MTQLTYQDFLNFFKSNPGCRIIIHMEYDGAQTKIWANTYRDERLFSMEGIVPTCDVDNILRNQNYWKTDYCANGVWSSDIALNT